MACSLHAPSELRDWVQCLFSVAICLRPWVAVCLSVLSSLLLLQRVWTGFVERLQDYAEESGKSRKSGCLPNSFIHTRLPQTDKLASTLVCFYYADMTQLVEYLASIQNVASPRLAVRLKVQRKI